MTDIRNDEDIQQLVYRFYDRVQEDERLGYIFNDVATVDWDHHLPNMVDFWSNILFRTGRYKGRPFRQHLPLPIQREDFNRWYGLFEETIDQLFEGEKANYAKEMAGKIASAFVLRMETEGKFNQTTDKNQMKPSKRDQDPLQIAEEVRKACLKAAREGFQDASMSGLCSEGAMEAATSAIQSLDLPKLLKTLPSNPSNQTEPDESQGS